PFSSQRSTHRSIAATQCSRGMATPPRNLRTRMSSSTAPAASASSSVGSRSVSRSVCSVVTTRELLDAAVHGLELRGADAIQLLAALPQLRQLVDACVAALEPLDDRLELLLRVLEAQLSQRSLRTSRRQRAR